jgi:hypothetical protein
MLLRFPMGELKGLGRDLVNLADRYQQSGDLNSAQKVVQMALTLGERMDQPGSLTLVSTFAGIQIEQAALRKMDPSSPYGNSGRTVQNQIDALTKRFDELRTLGPPVSEIVANMSDQDLVSYFDRTRMFGEEAASRWVLSNSQQK